MKTAFNIVDIAKCFLALLVHKKRCPNCGKVAPADGKMRITKNVLSQIPDNYGSVMEIKDLGDSFFVRVLGLEELESNIDLMKQRLSTLESARSRLEEELVKNSELLKKSGDSSEPLKEKNK